MYRRTQLASAMLIAGLLVACTSTDTDPVAPTPTTSKIARFSLDGATASAWYYASQLQEIKGWGLYPGGGGNPFWNAPSVQTALYSMGATIIRDQIDPALYVSGNNLSNMVLNTALLNQYIAKIAAAKAAGVTGYVLTVWSPPAVWKTNGSILGEVGTNVGYLISADEPALVAFMTKVLLTLKSSSIGLPMAVGVQNEPAHLATYAGCEYDVADWQQLIQDTRGSFDYNGLGNVTLFGPETGEYTPAVYIDYVTGAPGYFGGLGYPALTGYLDHAVGAYAFHTYAECDLWETQQAVAAHPKDMWMTEFGNPQGSTELEWTLDMMSAMAAHLIIVPHNYWFWWMGWTPTSGAPPFGQLLGGETTPVYSKRYWALQKLWKTVTPGWHVNKLWTNDPDLQTAWGTQNECTARVNLVGFSSPDGKTAVVEITNITNNNKAIQVGGLPGSVQTSYRTDANNDMVAQAVTNVYKGYSTIQAPANSLVIAIFQ